MAAVSAPHAQSAPTPPSSSHDWNYSVPSQTEKSQAKSSDFAKSSHQTNGNSLSHSSSRPDLASRRTDTYSSGRSTESGHLAPARLNVLNRKDSSVSETGSAPDSLLDLYGPNRSNINSMESSDRIFQAENGYGKQDDLEHSRWIHRDKLARIESQELQAAGIIFPRPRAPSKSSRRENSRDKQGNGLRSEQGQKWHQIEALPTEEEEKIEPINRWDLRLPEEVAEDQGDIYRDLSGKQGVSRIPVCKTSPVPIAIQHLERDTPIRRNQSGRSLGEEEPINYSKSRGRSQSIKALGQAASSPSPTKRSVSDMSPNKKPALRKASFNGARTTSAQQRPKTRSGPNRDPSNQRPPTRSNELNKRPEGDPPWLANMYKPDPRLPPDQQLLPTVAKRLQQEQWEKEGKFGNAYDTEFRPLNDDEFHLPPSPPPQAMEAEEPKAEKHDSEWPLRSPKSPTSTPSRPGTAGAYSTMPKIMGTPQGVGPLPSPKPAIRLPQDPSTNEKSKGSCACCVVM